MSEDFNHLLYTWRESCKGPSGRLEARRMSEALPDPLEHVLALWVRSANAAAGSGRVHCDFHDYCLALNIPHAPFTPWLDSKRGKCIPDPCLPEGRTYWGQQWLYALTQEDQETSDHPDQESDHVDR